MDIVDLGKFCFLKVIKWTCINGNINEYHTDQSMELDQNHLKNTLAEPVDPEYLPWDEVVPDSEDEEAVAKYIQMINEQAVDISVTSPIANISQESPRLTRKKKVRNYTF